MPIGRGDPNLVRHDQGAVRKHNARAYECRRAVVNRQGFGWVECLAAVTRGTDPRLTCQGVVAIDPPTKLAVRAINRKEWAILVGLCLDDRRFPGTTSIAGGNDLDVARPQFNRREVGGTIGTKGNGRI